MAAAKKISGIPNVAEQLARTLRHEIADGILPVGSTMPAEHILMEKHGISRPTCREALRILQSEGLVRVKRGNQGGAVVQSPDPDRIAEYAGVFLKMRGSTIADVFETRILVEPSIVAGLAAAPDPRILSELSQICAAQKWLVGDRPQFYETSRKFRRILISQCTSEPLRLIALMIGQIAEMQLTRMSFDLPNRPGQEREFLDTVEMKIDMIEAIARGDGVEAARIWREYLSFYLELLERVMPDGDDRLEGLVLR